LRFTSIYGVDFSGAKLAGRNIWIARAVPVLSSPCCCGRNGAAISSKSSVAVSRESRRASARGTRPALRLVELSCLEHLCGTAEREPSLAHLVNLIRTSTGALWAMDFPFGLPIEVMEDGARWAAQFDFLGEWGDDAYGVGLECLRRAKRRGGPMHIRRTTDVEARAPFDCYHYRIIYQFFYGMRDVLGPVAGTRGTAILPFQYRRLPRAERVLVEACPSSTLKRLGLPHQNYKQPQGGPLTGKRRRTRHAILEGLAHHITIGDRHRRTIMRNGGGDALDAVIAAVGGFQGWHDADHRAVARHARYPREGRLYV
jgi:hypothetical protein